MLLLALLLACLPAADPCDAMCAAAADREGACLSDEGLDWSAAGYADSTDFEDACGTWAWEQRKLARDAGISSAAVTATCEARQAVFQDGSCDDAAGVDWNAPAWEDGS